MKAGYAHLSTPQTPAQCSTRGRHSVRVYGMWESWHSSQKEFTFICVLPGLQGEKRVVGVILHRRVASDTVWKHSTDTKARIVLMVLGAHPPSWLRTSQLSMILRLESPSFLISSSYYLWGQAPLSRLGLPDLANKSTGLQLNLNFRSTMIEFFLFRISICHATCRT